MSFVWHGIWNYEWNYVWNFAARITQSFKAGESDSCYLLARVTTNLVQVQASALVGIADTPRDVPQGRNVNNVSRAVVNRSAIITKYVMCRWNVITKYFALYNRITE